MKDLALALGGGGVKGNAHVGVLAYLEQNGFRVRAVAGTSAGGLVGALYAYGYTPDEILRRFQAADASILFARRPGDGPGWLGLDGMRTFLEDALGDCDFAHLRMPFAVTAVDLDTAEYRMLDSGRLVDALLATIAVPGVFPPACLEGHMLVDGAVLDPVPAGLARRLAPGLPVVAVVLSPPVDEWGGPTNPRLLGSLPVLSRYLSHSRFTQSLNIFMRSIDIAGALLTELLLQMEQPDVIIRPDVRNIGLLDEVEAPVVARLGEQAAERALPELERVVGWPARLSRRFRRFPQVQMRLPVRDDFGNSA